MWIRVIIILGVLGLAEFYSFIVLRSALRSLPVSWRTALIALYFVLTFVTWLCILFFRSVHWQALPHTLRNIYVTFMLGFIAAKLLILVFMLLDEVRRLLAWVTQLFYTGGTPAATAATHAGIPRSVFISRVALVAGGAIITAFIYGTANRYAYRVRRIRIRPHNLPEAFRGLKIVQLSDIHTGSFDNPEAVMRGIQKVLDEKPDLIVFTGDLVNNRTDEIESYREIFSALNAPMGVYSVLGNHDYGDYVNWSSPAEKRKNLEDLIRIQEEMGWRLLMNEHVVLEREGQQIALIGIENWSARAGFPKYGNMRKAYEGLPEKNIPFKILLSHDPSHWDAEVRPQYGDVDLTLSGHTHGMQLGVEIPGFRWSPAQYVYKEWAGLYQEGKQYLYVNRGFGFLGYPGRLGIMPEITVIELA
jgi:predicted MPP superfamily phosphohydrolase